MEENIKVISDMCQGIFAIFIIVLLLMIVNVCCILFITDYFNKRDKEVNDKLRDERIKRREDVDYRLLAHSQQLHYLLDEFDKLKKRKKS